MDGPHFEEMMIHLSDAAIRLHLYKVHESLRDFCGNKKDVQEALDQTFFAGGCFAAIMRNQKPNDYDVWFRTRSAFDTVEKAIKDRAIRWSRFAITIVLPSGERVQLVENRIGHPEKTIAGFDFDHTRNFFCPKTGAFQVQRDLIQDKILAYTPGNLEHPVNTFQRVMKFAREGYTMEFSSIKNLMLDMREVQKTVIVEDRAGSR